MEYNDGNICYWYYIYENGEHWAHATCLKEKVKLSKIPKNDIPHIGVANMYHNCICPACDRFIRIVYGKEMYDAINY